MTGTARAAASSSAARNRSGSRTVSRNRPITLVESNPSAYSTYSPTVVTISCPEETIRLNPMPRSLNAIAANADPEWLMKATGPRRSSSGVGKPVARRPASRLRNPIPFPPQNAMACSFAIAARRAVRGGPCGSAPSSNRLANVVALLAPAAAASASAASIRAFATPRIARSTGSGTSPMLA